MTKYKIKLTLGDGSVFVDSNTYTDLEGRMKVIEAATKSTSDGTLFHFKMPCKDGVYYFNAHIMKSAYLSVVKVWW